MAIVVDQLDTRPSFAFHSQTDFVATGISTSEGALNRSLLVFAVCSRALHGLYEEVKKQSSSTDVEIASELELICDSIRLSGCRESWAALSAYCSLISLYRPDLGLSFDESGILDPPCCAATVTAPEYIEILRRRVGQDERLARGLEFLRLRFEGLLGSAVALGRAREMVEQLEADIRRDPSRPDLWVRAALLHQQVGNFGRAHQLLKRACASGYAAREEAQRQLGALVDSIWFSPSAQRA